MKTYNPHLIPVTCPNCGKQGLCPAKLVSMEVGCPHCEYHFCPLEPEPPPIIIHREASVDIQVGPIKAGSKMELSVDKQTAREIKKVALGGLLGLVLAQLIIWWVLGADPFGTAPWVGSVFPPVVPEELVK